MRSCDMCEKKDSKDNPVSTVYLGRGFSDDYDICLMCRQGWKLEIENFRNMDKHFTEVSKKEEEELLK